MSSAKKRPISAGMAVVDEAAVAALADLEQRLGYKFADTRLLEACPHAPLLRL